MNYKYHTEQVMSDPRYQKNIEYGEPRSGHPEGKVKNHIRDLEKNLESLKNRLNEHEYWKLKFLIHVHDTFKADALGDGTPLLHPLNHATLAKKFASEFIDDSDMLNILQHHDNNYAFWKQFKATGQYDHEQFMNLLNLIKDWDLFLAFTIVDGFTPGKDLSKLPWFINEVKKYKETRVDESWTCIE